MIINLYNNFNGNISFDYENIIKTIENGILEEKEVSLILVDIDEIHRMNLEFRNIDNPTDVISFEESDEENENYLGDIFICVDKVIEQAKLYNHSDEREFAFLLIHGILHLSGYDHMTENDEKIMFTKQDEILNKLGFRREKNEIK